MKTKEDIEAELKLLDNVREEIRVKLENINSNISNANRDELADTLINGLTTIVKYYTLCWVIEKSTDRELHLLREKIKNEYIMPLSSMLKELLKR